MRILFIHQNLPGQFRHLLQHYAAIPTVEVFGLGENVRIKENIRQKIGGMTVCGYRYKSPNVDLVPHDLRFSATTLDRGKAVARALSELKKNGFNPDIVYGHPGWGETLYVRDIFPNAKLVDYCEFFFRRTGQDFGFDPEFRNRNDDGLHVRTQNMAQLASLTSADAGICPTYWQRAQYPAILQKGISVIHDGIDTNIATPASGVRVTVGAESITLCRDDEVITYAARNLEPYRGFHIFMRALPEILARRPRAHVIIVGGDDVSYGRHLPDGTYRERALREVGDRMDRSRVHFVGHLPRRSYLSILQISTVHVYLTYPFVLSWSILEAMAAGCVVVASDTAPVKEVVKHEENGFLVDFFSPPAIAEAVSMLCAKRTELGGVREAARRTIVERYDLSSICLPRQTQFLESLVYGSSRASSSSVDARVA